MHNFVFYYAETLEFDEIGYKGSYKPERKHIMQEEKGGPTCPGSLSLCKLCAPVVTAAVKRVPLGIFFN